MAYSEVTPTGRFSVAHDTHCTIDRVVVFENPDSSNCGIYASECDHLVISNCAISGRGASGGYPDPGDFALTLFDCSETLLGNCSVHVTNGIGVQINRGSATLTNSALWTAGSGGYCILLTDGVISSDYNDLYTTSFARIASANGMTMSTLASWQAFSGQDAHSISADPLFADAANGDFRLTAGSPCIDAADGDAAPPRDYDGFPRIDDPATNPNTGAGTPDYADIGAHEFLGGATLHRLTVRSMPVAAVPVAGDEPGLTEYFVDCIADSSVSLRAPLNVPGGSFRRWEDETGAVLTTDAEITVPMDTARTIVAAYPELLPSPSSLSVDLTVMSGAELTLNAPACNSLQLLSIDPGANPPDTPIAIWLNSGVASGWLRLVPAPGRGFDAYADGTAPEPHPASDWANRRLRGLAAGTNHAFYALATTGGLESELAHVATYATNPHCDVNRSLGDPWPVTGIDFALMRGEIFGGTTVGVDQSWACDVNGDGLVDFNDLFDLLDALRNP
jgi:hypothetical protein